ncbi:hypothetical protein VU03_00940, partial [Desulfobulbus sp. N3]|nr:hypothetical protein [Desulfobulbus sp. N3]
TGTRGGRTIKYAVASAFSGSTVAVGDLLEIKTEAGQVAIELLYFFELFKRDFCGFCSLVLR